MIQPSRRQVLAAGLAVAAGSLAGCSTDVVVARGDRANAPTAPYPDPGSIAPPRIDLASLPGYTPPTDEGGGTYSREFVDGQGRVRWQILDADHNVIPHYTAPEDVVFGPPGTYNQLPGVLNFRGNNWRTGGSYGTPRITERRLERVWEKQTGRVRGEGSYWPGAGWTGQPLLVQWPRETKVAMGLDARFVDDDGFVEVIYPTFEGKIYRLDLATGDETRPAMEAIWGFKGTASVDPRGYPLLYAGQGLNDRNGTIGPWRWRVFDLIANEEVWHLQGLDPSSHRPDWGAWDSNVLIEVNTDTAIEPSENGLIYKLKLNTSYDPGAARVELAPEITRLRYDADSSHKYGIENSAVAYGNLMFAADNDGHLFCWDATSLEIVWMTHVHDDTDASLILDVEPDGGVYLYTGNEVDIRGQNGGERICNVRKVNAFTGEFVWQFDIPAYYEAINGGLMGTPMAGTGPSADLMFFNLARTTAPREGTLVALEKASGNVVWRRHLSDYSWSSPVLVTAEDGAQYGVLPDSGGTLHLFDVTTGLDVASLQVSGGLNVEATPSVFNGTMVFAGYDAKIHCIKVV